jgi:perosamine synthetase
MDSYLQLEKEYKKFVGSKYAVSCNSGTSALHLALKAIGVGYGDEVIVPEFTMIACAYAVSYCGATPVFVDCRDDLSINPYLIEEKLTGRTKAIMPVHIYGILCDMKTILSIAKDNRLKVVEDACEAQGAVYKSEADITCYSFYKNKIIHAEEGGIATTDNKKYADRMNYLKNMCFNKKHNYIHEEIGFNYRMPDSQATLALHSLHNYSQEKERRQEQVDKYNKRFGLNVKNDANWIYPIKNADNWIKNYDGLYADLKTREFFKPMSQQPPYFDLNYKNLNAYRLSKQGMYIKL